MVGPHVTDLIEAGTVALDAEATVETVADGMAAHPTLSEAIKEAGLVALGRAIHLPNKKRAAARPSDKVFVAQGFRGGISLARTCPRPHLGPRRPPAPPFSQSRPLAAEGRFVFLAVACSDPRERSRARRSLIRDGRLRTCPRDSPWDMAGTAQRTLLASRR